VVNSHDGSQAVCFEKIGVFKAGCCLNGLAWNNGIKPWCYFIGYGTGVIMMIKRDSWGRSYFVVSGEILGYTNNDSELVQKHSARRKLGDRRRSDTVVVLTINYAN
jgi:hypothetical protein